MGTHKIEFVQRVPHSVEAIFSIGSYDPPALLLYALEQYEKGDVCAQESLRPIKDQLADAVSTCLDAALCEVGQEKERREEKNKREREREDRKIMKIDRWLIPTANRLHSITTLVLLQVECLLDYFGHTLTFSPIFVVFPLFSITKVSPFHSGSLCLHRFFQAFFTVCRRRLPSKAF